MDADERAHRVTDGRRRRDQPLSSRGRRRAGSVTASASAADPMELIGLEFPLWARVFGPSGLQMVRTGFGLIR